MTFRTWAAALLAGGALLTGLLIAQDRADIIVEVVNIQVPVSVQDQDDRFVNGLTPVDFQLFDNGIPQNITEDVATHPISLVVAIQANSKTERILPEVQKVSSLFDTLVVGETGEIAVLGFDHRVQTLTEFTSNPDDIKGAFQKLKTGSSQSHMNDAAMQAVRMLRNRGRDRKKILMLISETRDVGSSIDTRDVLTEAEFANVVIYAVEMSHYLNILTSKTEPNRPNAIPPANRPPLPMGTIQTYTTDSQTNMGNWTPIIKEIFTLVKGVFIPNSLEVYTRYTGGREENFVGLNGLEEAISRIGEEIHSQYLLTFSPSQRDQPGYHEIIVRIPARPGLRVTARRGYWIAPREAAPAEEKN
jgi:VWFA-related protein